MSGSEPRATVLVVDDEEDVADAYALRLEEHYDVRTAYGGRDALDTVDDDVHVVLLDRRMPDMSGDEVLDELRDRGYGCRVVMVTAVDPDFEIIDMPFDDYLQKPVDRETLFETIDEQVDTLDRDAAVSELFSVTAKAGVLEQRKSREELADHPEYRELKARADELREQIHGSAAVDASGVAPPGSGDGEAAASHGSASGPDGTTAADEPDGSSQGLLGRIMGLFGD